MASSVEVSLVNRLLSTQSSSYRCRFISRDIARASGGEYHGLKSFFGPRDITDAYLKGNDGSPFATVRSENWNTEFLKIPTEDFALVIDDSGELRNISMRQFLQKPTKFGAGYTGLDELTSLSMFSDCVNVRFETVFIPVKGESEGLGGLQFAVETYSTAEQTDENPCNLILLATTEGLSVQGDGKNMKRVLMHADTGNGINEYWLKLENSNRKTVESNSVATIGRDVSKTGGGRGKGIGIDLLRTRSNVLMVIQVPVRRIPANADSSRFEDLSGRAEPTENNSTRNPFSIPSGSSAGIGTANPPRQLSTLGNTGKSPARNPLDSTSELSGSVGSADAAKHTCSTDTDSLWNRTNSLTLENTPGSNTQRNAIKTSLSNPSGPSESPSADEPDANTGHIFEGIRVSRGDFHTKRQGLLKYRFARNFVNVTATCLIVKTISGSVPSKQEVLAAVTEMESLYKSGANSALPTPLPGFTTPDWKGKHALQNKQEALVQPSAVARSLQTSLKPCRLTPVASPPPLHSSRLNSVKDIVMTKLRNFESTMANFTSVMKTETVHEASILELKLLTFGALQSESVKTLLEKKFDSLSLSISCGNNSTAKDLLLELELLILGSFDLQKRDASQMQ